jgi:serine/threonine protein kinase
VVLEPFEGVLRGGHGDGAAFLRRARAVATLAHPNLAPVRSVTVDGDDVLLAGAFVDGEKLSQLWRFDREAMPLDVGLRVLVGALAGLGALHGPSGSRLPSTHLAHGEIGPTTILLGVDGVSRVLHAAARQAPGVKPEHGSIEYLAPEVLEHDTTSERADIFAVGVLLWELLTGRRLRIGESRAAPPLACATEDVPWVQALVDVAERALHPAPAERWPTAAAMAKEIEDLAGSRVASTARAAAWLDSVAGERVRSRRARLEAAPPVGSPSVALPRLSAGIAGKNPVEAVGPRTATLPPPSDGRSSEETPADSIVGASIPIPPSPEREAEPSSARLVNSRGFVMCAAACAAGALALALFAGTAPSTRADERIASDETAAAPPMSESDPRITLFSTPLLTPRALPEVVRAKPTRIQRKR